MNCSFITLTNLGYLDYTRNLIKSLELCESKIKLKVYCVGQECFDSLDYDNKVMLECDAPSGQQLFRQGDWNKIVVQKFACISKELETNGRVLFTDGDIVWLNNRFFDDIDNRLDDNDILFQNDKQNDNDTSELCSGIIYARSNVRTRQLFDIKTIDMDNFKCDQIFFNERKTSMSYAMLPLRKYPNGMYHRTKQPAAPYCIHFNYLIGDTKMEMMKSLNHWYI